MRSFCGANIHVVLEVHSPAKNLEILINNLSIDYRIWQRSIENIALITQRALEE
jgi:hypothetical protein